MAIREDTVRRILDTARIEEVVGDYVTLRRRGSSLLGLCPFHNEKTPSFHVNTARNYYKCFGCGKGGGTAGFLMEIEHVSYPDALRMLAKKYGIEVEEKRLSAGELAAQSEREALFAANDFANGYFQKYLWETDDGRLEGLSYYRGRGFSDEIIRRFQLGYAPNASDALYRAATAAGHSRDTLLKAGLIGVSDNGRVYDKFRGRVMFPVFTVSGRVVAFSGRILVKDPHAAKYVNSPETPVYTKGNEVYGLYVARRGIGEHDVCYLVEGNADVVSMHQAGVTNVVASLGTALTPRQAQLIRRQTENVAVLYDGDSAGVHAALKAVDLLLAERFKSVRVLLWPDGEDPDSFARSHSTEELRSYIDTRMEDGVFFKLRMASAGAEGDPARTAQAIAQVAGTIAVIPDKLLRSTYIRFVADKVNMKEEDLAQMVEEFARQRRYQRAQEKIREERLRQAGGEYSPEPAPPRETPPPPDSEYGQPAPPRETPPPPAAFGTVPVSANAPVQESVSARPPKAVTYLAERNLLCAIICHGAEPLAFDCDPVSGVIRPLRPDAEPPEGHELLECPLFDYMIQSLAADDARLDDPVHQQVYEELRQVTDVSGGLEGRFLNHADPEVQRMVSEYIDLRAADPDETPGQRRYRMSQMAYQVLLEYRDAVLRASQRKMQELINEIDDPESEELDDLIRRKNEIENERREIGKLLGTRVYMK